MPSVWVFGVCVEPVLRGNALSIVFIKDCFRFFAVDAGTKQFYEGVLWSKVHFKGSLSKALNKETGYKYTEHAQSQSEKRCIIAPSCIKIVPVKLLQV